MLEQEHLKQNGPEKPAGINALEQARREYVIRSGHGSLIDLTNSRFDRAGLPVPEEVYAVAWREWRHKPAYTPSGRGSETARTAVAAFLSRDQYTVDADDVVITAGSSVSYHLLFAHLRDSTAASETVSASPPRVALPLPGYPLFEDLLRDAGLEPCWYHCLPKKQFQPDVAEIETLLSGAGWAVPHDDRTTDAPIHPPAASRGPVVAVVVISPNNPSGVVLSPETERAITTTCERAGAMLIVDEVFAPFVSANEPSDGSSDEPSDGSSDEPSDGPVREAGAPSSSEAGAAFGPVVRINGLSKIAAAPEVKLGWIAVTGGDAGNRRKLVDDLDTRHDTYLTVSGFAEACVEVFLEDNPATINLGADGGRGSAWLATVRNTVNRYRAVFDRNLAEIPALEDPRRTVRRGGIHRVLQLDPTFAAMRFGTLDDEAIAIRILAETGVLIHPGYLYGLDVPVFGSGPWFVVSCLNTEEILTSAVSRLHRVLR